MRQLKFNIGDTVYFFTTSDQCDFVNKLSLFSVNSDPYRVLITKARVNAIHIYNNKSIQYDTRDSDNRWQNVEEDCLYESYDAAKAALQQLVYKRLEELKKRF